MSKKAAGSKKRDRVSPRKEVAVADESRREPAAFLPPFKPRRPLFYGLLAALALWVCVLLGLYAFTVYPTRHAKSDRPPDAAASETVSR